MGSEADALSALKRRDLFEAEFQAKLGEGKEEILESYRQRGFLNDLRLATQIAEQNLDHGDEWITEKLRSRGATEHAISHALAQIPPEEDRILRVKIGNRDRVKAARFLFGRGFRQECIEARQNTDL